MKKKDIYIGLFYDSRYGWDRYHIYDRLVDVTFKSLYTLEEVTVRLDRMNKDTSVVYCIQCTQQTDSPYTRDKNRYCSYCYLSQFD